MVKNYPRIMRVIAAVILIVVIIGMILIRDRGVDTDITARTTRVGLVLTGAKNDASFCQAHYDSLLKIGDELNLEIICRENIPEDESCRTVIKELVEKEGCGIVVSASFGYGAYVTEMAEKYPEVFFLHPLGTEKLTNLASCMGRMYQARYLSGIVAGMRTESGKIGYVAAYDNSEVIRDLNAFTLGVRSVSPDAEVYVRYCRSWVDDGAAEAAFRELMEKHPDIDVMARHTNSLKPDRLAEERGLWSVGFNMDTAELFPDSYLTACEWHWDAYYRKKILSCLQGKFYGNIEWMDMGSGILGLSELTANVAPGTREAVEEAESRFADRSFDVFYGPVYDNEGKLRIPEGESMSDDEMMNSFGWYVEGLTVDE
ncbi:MAG: BMP family ABC transporter substrate-binding protein [Lachnospiraceae bacterium]|nr:BMP family ABC transporter substrate-binding protein [Lachnospiraceae bacterium]